MGVCRADTLDTIPQGIAEGIRRAATNTVLTQKVALTTDSIQTRFPGVDFVAESTGPHEVSITVNRTDLAVAIQAQSGRCYYLTSAISTSTVTRYGVVDQPTQCRADTSQDHAIQASWPKQH